MIQTVICFFLGIHIGQEYGNQIPNVRDMSNNLLKEFQKTDFYDIYFDKKDK